MSTRRIVTRVVSTEKTDDLPDVLELREPQTFKDPLDEALREKCKELYMSHQSHAEISLATGVKRGTIATWINRGGWSQIRAGSDETADREFLAAKKIKYDILSDLILDNAIRTVKAAAKSGKGFKAREFQTFVAMLPNLEKMNRLNKGMATSISEERSKRATFTIPTDHLRQIAAQKAEDPFDPSGNGSGTP